ncbi:MAG: DUF3040 domain-containing protein [Corynebacterium sp.]|nr:DUF3040 domain-containing protein [Corynebacterium sp.]
MALSEQEQRALRDLERSLLADDPKFGSAISDLEEGPAFGKVGLRGIAIIVIGLLLLVGGVALSQASLWFVVLSVFGFFVMLGGGIWMMRGGSDSNSAAAPKLKSAKPAKSNPNNSIGGRMEDNFRRRFE